MVWKNCAVFWLISGRSTFMEKMSASISLISNSFEPCTASVNGSLSDNNWIYKAIIAKAEETVFSLKQEEMTSRSKNLLQHSLQQLPPLIRPWHTYEIKLWLSYNGIYKTPSRPGACWKSFGNAWMWLFQVQFYILHENIESFYELVIDWIRIYKLLTFCFWFLGHGQRKR